MSSIEYQLSKFDINKLTEFNIDFTLVSLKNREKDDLYSHILDKIKKSIKIIIDPLSTDHHKALIFPKLNDSNIKEIIHKSSPPNDFSTDTISCFKPVYLILNNNFSSYSSHYNDIMKYLHTSRPPKFNIGFILGRLQKSNISIFKYMNYVILSSSILYEDLIYFYSKFIISMDFTDFYQLYNRVTASDQRFLIFDCSSSIFYWYKIDKISPIKYIKNKKFSDINISFRSDE